MISIWDLHVVCLVYNQAIKFKAKLFSVKGIKLINQHLTHIETSHDSESINKPDFNKFINFHIKFHVIFLYLRTLK